MSSKNTFEIDEFISGLSDGVNLIETYIEESLEEITAIVVREIGKKIAYDTTISRGIIQDILSELNAPNMQKALKAKIYEYWKSYEDREQEDKDYLVVRSKDNITIMIEDYGIANQELGAVSKNHPRKSSRVIPFPIEDTLDKFLTGGNKAIDREFEKIHRGLVKLIETGGI